MFPNSSQEDIDVTFLSPECAPPLPCLSNVPSGRSCDELCGDESDCSNTRYTVTGHDRRRISKGGYMELKKEKRGGNHSSLWPDTDDGRRRMSVTCWNCSRPLTRPPSWGIDFRCSPRKTIHSPPRTSTDTSDHQDSPSPSVFPRTDPMDDPAHKSTTVENSHMEPMVTCQVVTC